MKILPIRNRKKRRRKKVFHFLCLFLSLSNTRFVFVSFFLMLLYFVQNSNLLFSTLYSFTNFTFLPLYVDIYEDSLIKQEVICRQEMKFGRICCASLLRNDSTEKEKNINFSIQLRFSNICHVYNKNYFVCLIKISF